MNSPARPLWQRLLWRRLRILGVLAAVLVVAGAAIYWLAPQWLLEARHWHQAREAGLDTRELVVNGQHWAYYEGGRGPTIMLLHGFGGSRHHWIEVAGRLSDNFHVIVPDLPGWGDSRPLADGSLGPRDQAERLAGFIARLAPRNLVLIGHGSGGLIAGLYAGSHPRHVAAVGFVASAGAGHVQVGQSGSHPLAYTDRAGFRQLLELAFAKAPQLPDRVADVFVERNQQHIERVRRGLQRLRQPRQARALEAALPGLAMPVLVLWCHDDKMIDYQAVNVFRQNLVHSPRIDVTTLFGCSHMPMLENPAATARAISQFMLPTRARSRSL